MKIKFESQGAVVGEDVQFTPNGKSVGKVIRIICEAEITDKEAQKEIKEGYKKKIQKNYNIPVSGISGYGVSSVSGYGVPVSGIPR